MQTRESQIAPGHSSMTKTFALFLYLSTSEYCQINKYLFFLNPYLKNTNQTYLLPSVIGLFTSVSANVDISVVFTGFSCHMSRRVLYLCFFQGFVGSEQPGWRLLFKSSALGLKEISAWM